MKAIIKYADGVRLGEAECTPLAPGLARVRVTASGVCATDAHIAADEYAHEPPVVMGHEISGVVNQVYDDSAKDWIGRSVVVETYFSTCETCKFCRGGRRNLCAQRRSLGSFENGGFASEVTVPVVNLHEIPEQVDSVDAVLMEPLACVANCLFDPPRIQAGEQVLVIGPGTMGLLAVQVALAAGAEVTVLGLPQDAAKLRIAEGYGARIAQEVPDGAFDVVIETAGAGPAVRAGLAAVAKAGKFIEMGILGSDVSVPWDLILYKELEVSSGFASTPESWRRAVVLVASGQVSLAGLVTSRFSLDDWHDAFAAVGGEGIKTVILPWVER